MVKTSENSPRPRQQLGEEIINDLLGVIRRQFYLDAEPKQWFQDRAFLLRRVVLWPAGWLTGRGVTLPPARYKALLLDIFTDIKRHGSTGAVKFWPGYLASCVQKHFAHHGDEIYNEAKSARTLVENALLCARQNTRTGTAPDPIADLARAASLLKGKPRRKSAPKSSQLSLL